MADASIMDGDVMNGPSILSIVPRQYVGALYVAAVLLALAVPNLHAAERSRTRRVADDKTFDTVILPIVKKYCVDCHGEDDPKGKVSFEDLEKPSQILENREVWVKAFKHLGIGGMPPTNKKRRPTRAQEQAFVEWLDLKLFHCDCDGDVDPGRETIQRLNRTEYTNTVRDLIGIETDVAKDFPSDDLGYGFSNIGDVLSLPPLLFEKYVGAAEKIAAAAVLTESLENRKKRLVDAQLKITGGVRATSEGWKVLYSSGSVYGDYEATHSGQYVIRFSAMADQAGPQVARMQVRVDGKSVKVFDVPDRRKERTFEVRRHLNKGRHRLEGAFINDYYQPKAKNPHDRDRNLAIRSIEVQGPIGVEPPS